MKNKDNDAEALRKALVLIREQRKQIEHFESKACEPIAIIGMGCRFPGGANNPDEFWKLLEQGYDASIEVPEARWDLEEYYDSDPTAPGKMITRKSTFMDVPVEQFDADFFNISPKEADALDPQQRLLLEITLEAFESAGIAIDRLRGANAAVYIGHCGHDYSNLTMRYSESSTIQAYNVTGNAASTASGRISYTFNLNGPCLAVDTACSSSIVALHLACKSLRNGETDLAITGGVNLLLDPSVTITFSKAHMLAPDGHCKTFDQSADGYVRGEGCGILVLKRLSDAQKDGDTILALVRGTAINQDGGSGGLTVPNGPAQENVIKEALKDAQLDASDISYIEAHGTGTSLGDPIEINALANVFSHKRNAKDPLIIGTVKTNIGHLETAAGVAGIIKTVLAMQHEKIPCHIHFKALNPVIAPLENIPAVLPLQQLEWKKTNQPRRAGVSSFGFSGTNGHVILEEAPSLEKPKQKKVQTICLLVLSAKTTESLKKLINKYINFLQNTDESVANICYTSQVGRTHYKERLALVGGSVEELIEQLKFYEQALLQNNSVQNVTDFDQDKFPQGLNYAKDWFSQDSEGLWQLKLLAKNESYKEGLITLGQLYSLGYAINWLCLYEGKITQMVKVQLPTYAFMRQHYWLAEIELANQKRVAFGETLLHPLLGNGLLGNVNEGFQFLQQRLQGKKLGYLQDHCVAGAIIFPGTGYVEMMLAALKAIKKDVSSDIILDDLSIEMPLQFHKNTEIILQTVISPGEQKDEYKLKIYSQIVDDIDINEESPAWRLHAQGRGRLSIKEAVSEHKESIDTLKKKCEHTVDAAYLYKQLAIQGLAYGPEFRLIDKLWVGKKNALAYISSEKVIDKEYQAYPALLDCCLQVTATLSDNNDPRYIYLPVAFQQIISYQPLPSAIYVHVTEGKSDNSDFALADLKVLDENNQLLLSIIGFKAQKVERRSLIKSLQQTSMVPQWCYAQHWLIQPLDTTITPTHELQFLWLIGEEPKLLKHLQSSLKVEKDNCILSLHKELQQSNNLKIECQKLVENVGTNKTVEIFYVLSPKPFNEIATLANTLPLLALVQQVLESKLSVKLWVVSSGSYILEHDKPNPQNLALGPINGFIKSLILEHPDLNIHHIDMDEVAVSKIVEEYLHKDEKEQIIAYRNDKRYVLRIQLAKEVYKSRQRVLLPSSDDYHLVKSASGIIDDLQWINHDSSTPEKDEIVIQIQAVGLNFRDVLNAMNLYPGDPGPLGGDCSGVVTKIGEAVKGLKIGDAVMGIAFGSLSTIARTKASLVIKKPEILSFSQAAAVPTVFLTAYWSLVELAKLTSGETVLIHAGAGGVGLAAIQVAQLVKANIIVTVGSEVKRAYLQSIGIKHIFDSRSLSYGEDIKKLTKNKGVDLVLNSLSGPGFIETSLDCCGKGARFIEIGKRDIWSEEQVKKIRPDVMYHTVALDNMLGESPEIIQKLFEKIRALFSSGSLTPIPVTEFPATGVINAFKYLQQAKQIGKVIVALPEKNLVTAQGTYLITGGLGGLGLEVAKFLVGEGALSIVLMGRRSPSEEAQEQIDLLTAHGVKVKIAAVDVSDEKQLTKLIQTINSKDMPLKGIFHTAGILDDAAIIKQSAESFERVFAAKAKGGWYLHDIVSQLKINLDYFVLFSSIASINGAKGQSNYAAANSFLDALGEFRYMQGLPVSLINWGPWSEIGMAKDLVSSHQRQGVYGLSPQQGLEGLSYAMHQGAIAMEIAHIDWKIIATKFIKVPSWLQILVSVTPQGQSQFLVKLRAAEPSKREKLLKQAISQEICNVLGSTTNQNIDEYRGFLEMGMDSLMAMEFKDRLQSMLELQIPNTVVFDYPNVAAITTYFMRELKLTVPKVAKMVDEQPEDKKAEIHQMSDSAVLDEINALLEAQRRI